MRRLWVIVLLGACSGRIERPHEQCDNRRDDDGDALVDCADPDCAGVDACADWDEDGIPAYLDPDPFHPNVGPIP